MAGSKKLISMALLIVGASAVPPIDPCAPPTQPPGTCASFACPKGTVPKAAVVLCGNALGALAADKCSSHRCCDVVTTVTTTPHAPCSTVTTTPGTTKTTTPGTTVTTTPGTTVTTTPKAPCSTVTTTPGTTVTTTPATTVTTTPGTTATTTPKAPRSTVTTTPGTTVTTTPATTVTTTPGSTVTTTPKAPCSTVTTTPGTTVTTTPATTVTTTPGTTVTTTPKAPCSTVTTTPGTTVTTTPATTVTTTPATTVTTTPGTTATTTPPAPTCSSFKCGAGFDLKNQNEACVGRQCTQKQCCALNPCAPVNMAKPVATQTTTPVPTKAVPTVKPVVPANPCAVAPIVGAPKATTAAPKATTAAPKASTGGPFVATTAAPKATTAAGAPRLYDAKAPVLVQEVASKKGASAVPAWALPFFGVLALFSMSAFIAVRARQGSRSTRQLRVVQPAWDTEDHDGESLLMDDAAAFQ